MTSHYFIVCVYAYINRYTLLCVCTKPESSYSDKQSMYILLADECPDDKYLNKYVREKVCGACASSPDIWRDLGIELMGQQSVSKLDEIKANNGGNVTLCCSAMFSLWRQRQPKANWSQLIIALKEIKLETLADDIEKLLLSSVEQQRHNEHVQNDQNMQHLDIGM